MTTTLKDQREAKLKELRDLADIAAKAERDFTDDEQAKATGLLNDVKDLTNQIKAASASANLVKEIEGLDAEKLDEAAAGALNEKALEGARLGFGGGLHLPPSKTLGQLVEDSPQMKAFRKAYPSGIPDNRKGIGFEPVSVESKALLTGVSDTSGGAMVRADWYGLLPLLYQRPLTIRDLITVGQTGTDQVDFARLVSVTNAAAPVPEATSQSNAEAVKPESSMTFEKDSTTVKTIAHWLAATKRALADVGQLRTLIDNFLRYGLQEELEDQIIDGDDSGENFDGILNVDGTQDQAFDEDIFVTIRKAITKVTVTGRAMVTGVVIHPADDEVIDLARDENGRFYGNGPFGTGPNTIWGRPRVVSEAVPEGTAIVADWRKAVLWDREQTTISATDSHEDFFVRNLVAILAELRAAFAVIQPSAFVIADVSGTS